MAGRLSGRSATRRGGASRTGGAVAAMSRSKHFRGQGNGKINRELAALKRMYSLAAEDDKLLHRPHIPKLEERNIRSGFFEREQFDAVRATLPADLKHVATFAYLTGWRVPSEILTLQWRQVDFAAGVVRHGNLSRVLVRVVLTSRSADCLRSGLCGRSTRCRRRGRSRIPPP
jgi:integrase